VINEVMTVAVGYALSNFTTITGTTINISASVTDNFSDGLVAWNGTTFRSAEPNPTHG
jgi:hypothetical protein